MSHVLQFGFYFAHNAWKLSKELASPSRPPLPQHSRTLTGGPGRPGGPASPCREGAPTCEQACPENPAPGSRAGPQETRWGPLAPRPRLGDTFLQGRHWGEGLAGQTGSLPARPTQLSGTTLWVEEHGPQERRSASRSFRQWDGAASHLHLAVGSLGPPEDWASDPLKRPQARL